MKVWLAREDDYDDTYIRAVGTTPEAAVGALKLYFKDYPVEWSEIETDRFGNKSVCGRFSEKRGLCSEHVMYVELFQMPLCGALEVGVE